MRKPSILTFADSVYYSIYDRSFAYRCFEDSLKSLFPDKETGEKYRKQSDTIFLGFENITDTLVRQAP